jgi:UDP-GlcNAc:undecaprenyl-phosphate/decaprenyl-phosphate GlcNAc-1-phosphate transferase
MATYYLAAGAAFVLSVVLTGLFSRLARSRGIFMPPVRERDIHVQPTPRVGGIAVVVSFLIVVLLWQLFLPQDLRFTSELVLGIDRKLFGLLLAVITLGIINVADDFRHVRWEVRLALQVVASLMVAAFGVQIGWLSNPFGNGWELGSFDWLFVVFWLVGLSNVVNWLDGVNGLAGGVSAIALAVLFFLSISPEVAQGENALVAAIAFGSVIGFMPYNIGRAKAFLGDTGSVFLGFMIGVLAIISGGKIATAFLVLAIPFIDAAAVVISRLRNKQSPFAPDKRHLHHRLLARGLKPWQIVGLYYLISLAFGLVALNTQTLGKLWAAISTLVVMAVLVGLYTFPARKTKLPPFNGDNT